MSRPPDLVLGPDGLRGTIESRAGAEGRTTIRLEDGRVLDVPSALLREQGDGTYRLEIDPATLGVAGAAGTAVGGRVDAEVARTQRVIPVVREELEVGKRRVETGTVRVQKVVREREEVVDVPLLRELVEVEHVPINRIIPGPVEPRQEGETWIIPLVEEVLVVEKRLMLREEVRVTRRQVEDHRPQRVTLRSEAAEVERAEIEGSTPQSR